MTPGYIYHFSISLALVYMKKKNNSLAACSQTTNCKRLEIRCVCGSGPRYCYGTPEKLDCKRKKKGTRDVRSDMFMKYTDCAEIKKDCGNISFDPFQYKFFSLCFVYTAFCAQIHTILTLHACCCIMYFDFLPEKKNAIHLHLPRAEMNC